MSATASEAIQIEVARAVTEISGSESGSALDPEDPGTLLVEVYDPRTSIDGDVVAELESTVTAICAEHGLGVSFTYGP
ncbi:hypothetical protein [Agrococcus sp. Marseille-Q4369]|uniref:hypothetical protein n=1 Tax=Agrococcus sp. Marseille-Q4369 TaxID=2810513 RepID=UPI001B8BCB92|nr:hypothetical protein [Agrococcus sp. Marseille-Q4369]QUW18640.1 hypothetical protein JSQ78_12755 [Agrococcus sp. Marseille-Q4369]